MSDMSFEIDFLPVESGQKSGDAIAVRYGQPGAYYYHVVDGGTVEAAKGLIEHINNFYGAPTRLDHVVCTHTDSDHSSGLREIIKAFEVGTIWMNRPWLYAAELVNSFKHGWTVDGLRKALREAYPITAEIEDLANEKGIPIKEAFQGAWIGPFLVTSPSRSFYLSMVPHFSCTPEPSDTRADGTGIFNKLKEVLGEARNFVAETLNSEYLPGGVTSASNESSVVQYAKLGDKTVLLTGDAGIDALNETITYLTQQNIPLRQFAMMQIPHHGSRRNVSTEVLNKLIGPPLSFIANNYCAIVSSSKKDEDHPRRRVVNAFTRRGFGVNKTEGQTICYGQYHGRGWGAAPIEPFYYEVEEDAA